MTSKLPWVLLAGVGAYALMRRQALRGGAMEDEVHTSLPGDDVIPHPMIETTHAVTIHAPPSVVWKWLIQAGYRGSGRAGWYSDSRFEALTEAYFRRTAPDELSSEKARMASAKEILPEFQQTAVGEVVPDGPEGTAYFVVKAVEPERVWVLHSDTHLKYLLPDLLRDSSLDVYGDFTWVFVLNPIAEAGTRLILRTRARYGPPLLRSLLLPFFYLGEAVIPRQILCGIKQRAESSAQSEG